MYCLINAYAFDNKKERVLPTGPQQFPLISQIILFVNYLQVNVSRLDDKHLIDKRTEIL